MKITDKQHRIRTRIINIAHRIAPRRFCWANLVMWSYGHNIGEPVSECQKQDRCYCGQWVNGKHISQMTQAELKELQTTESDLNELPF